MNQKKKYISVDNFYSYLCYRYLLLLLCALYLRCSSICIFFLIFFFNFITLFLFLRKDYVLHILFHYFFVCFLLVILSMSSFLYSFIILARPPCHNIFLSSQHHTSHSLLYTVKCFPSSVFSQHTRTLGIILIITLFFYYFQILLSNFIIFIHLFFNIFPPSTSLSFPSFFYLDKNFLSYLSINFLLMFLCSGFLMSIFVFS